MNTLETIEAHRSIRQFKSDPIPQGDLDAIIHSATRGSSSGNMQTYSIIVTRDPKRREALWELHLEQDMIRQAPVLLTFCVDWNRMNQWCRLRGATPGFDNFLCFLVGFADALIAAQNAALAAESIGYGICYMGTTLCATPGLIEHFGLPDGVFPATTLVVGLPDEDPEPRARLPLESVVHEEEYQEFDEDRTLETYRDREAEGWNRYMKFPDLARRIRESGVTNLAQVYTEVKYTAERNRGFSRDLLGGLAGQGFMRDDEPT
ncbi:MAG: nitroreductase family protein [Planctomycetota bacterium]|nr:nitroreductase family protein [Planctomycetota bacterium]